MDRNANRLARLFSRPGRIVLVAAAAARLVSPTLGDERYLTGVPWWGEPGITQTVAEIVARSEPVVPQAAPVADAIEDAPVPLSAQAVGTSFLATQLSESGVTPPDSSGAVGPTQVMVVSNGRVKLFDKAGNLSGLDVSDATFFDAVRDGTGVRGPHVRYDRLSGRWFITEINVSNTSNRILIAVSSGSTITSASSFTFYQFSHDLVGPAPNADTGHFADAARLGVDQNALYIGVNELTSGTGSFQNTTGYVVNKANLIGGTLTVTAFRGLAIGTGPGPFTPQGVDNDDPDATEGYFIGVDNKTLGTLMIRRVTNPGGTPAISDNIRLTVPPTSYPLGQPALGSASALDSLDDRLFAAMIKKNKNTGVLSLWTAHNIAVTAAGATNRATRNGARWYELGSLAATPAVIQSGTLFDSAAKNPRGFWLPSVAANGQGHMALGASVAGAADAAGIAVAGRLSSDELGTLQPFSIAVAGAAAYNAQTGVVRQRWGGYSQMVVDPTDDQTMWAFQEYCNATDSWGVRAIRLLAPPPATPSSAGPASLSQGVGSAAITIAGTSIGGSGFFDPGAGFANRLTASVTGGVTVNSVTYVNPTTVVMNVSTAAATSGLKNVTITNPDGQSVTGYGLFSVAAAGANTAPVISNIPDTSINEDAASIVTFMVNDAESGASGVGVSAQSSNTALVSNADLAVQGSGFSRNLTITPAANQSGTTTITITASDGALTTSDSFVLTVVAVDDAPAISAIGYQTTGKDSPAGPIAFSVSDVETAAAALTVAGASSNTALVPNANIVFGGSGESRTVTITPAAGQSGTTMITVTVSDGSLTASRSFGLAVVPVRPWAPFQHDLQHTGRSAFVGPQTPTPGWVFSTDGVPGSPAIDADGTIYLPTGMLNIDSIGYVYAINPDGTQKWRAQLPRFLPSSTAPAIGPDGTIYVHGNGADFRLADIEMVSAVTPGGVVKWTFETNGGAPSFTSAIQSSPAVAADGTIYVGAMNGLLYALNPDASIKWTRSPSGSSIDSSPAVAADGTIYVHDRFGLYAYDPAGTPRWHTVIAVTGADGSPSIAPDGTVYVAHGENKKLYAVGPGGAAIWDYTLGSGPKSTPAIGADGTIYIGDDGLYALNPDGTLKWKRPASPVSSSSASPIVGGDGTIYWRAGFTFYAFNPDGSERWSFTVQPFPAGSLDSTPALGSDGTLYVPHTGFTSGLRAYITRPAIVTQPQSQTIAPAQTAALSVAASGNSPLTYQWYAGTSGSASSPIGGATSSTYTTPALTAATSYWVRVSNAYGADDSATATISMAFADVPTPAGMLSPTPGATLGTSVTFNWTSGWDVSHIWLDVGTTPGGSQIYGATQGTSTSRTVTGVPVNGATIHVRLWSLIPAGWSFTDYTYAAPVPVPAGILTPTPGSTLPATSVTFTWTPGTFVSQIWLDVGSSIGGSQYYGATQGTAASHTVNGLPVNGSTVYVRLWSLTSGGWGFTDYSYTAINILPIPAGMLTPVAGATLPGSSTTWSWTRGTEISQIWLDVGSTPGGAQYYGATQGTGTSRTVGGLPADNSTVYARLWSLSRLGWSFTDYIFKASTAAIANMMSPPSNTAFTGPSTTFSWTVPAGVSQIWLDVGGTIGGSQVYGATQGMGSSRSVGGIPTDGAPVYARLWTLTGGAWQFIDYFYTAVALNRAALASPASASTLP